MSKERPRTRRKITIAVEERVVRWLRKRAARRHASVSQVVGEILGQKMRDDEAYEAALRTAFEIVEPVNFEKPGGRFPTRDELYDRPKRWS